MSELDGENKRLAIKLAEKEESVVKLENELHSLRYQQSWIFFCH
jgi:hypothetical protein